MATWPDVIAAAEDKVAELSALTSAARSRAEQIKMAAQSERRALTRDERDEISSFVAQSEQLAVKVARAQSTLKNYQAEKAADDWQDKMSARTSTTTGAKLPAYDSVFRVGAEERTYTRAKSARPTSEGGLSFFGDVIAMASGDFAARQRVERSQVEVVREGEIRETHFTTRATSTGSLSGLVIPQYLIEEVALALRSGRPLANALRREQIPDEGMSLIIPQASTGVSAAVQASENSAVSSTDSNYAALTLPVSTIAGQAQMSRQSLDRGTPGLDQLIMTDLANAYAAQVEAAIVNGSGASGQVRGIMNTTGINLSSTYAAAATIPTFYTKMAGAVNAVSSSGAGITARLIAMAPRRWAWLLAATDTSGRPLVTPTGNGPYNATGVNSMPGYYSGDPNSMTSSTVVGQLHGLPVITSTAIPTNVGGGSSEDVAFVLDTQASILFEDLTNDGAPRFLNFEQTLGNQMTTTLVAYSYIAFTAGRYPTSITKVGGVDTTATNGQQAPALL